MMRIVKLALCLVFALSVGLPRTTYAQWVVPGSWPPGTPTQPTATAACQADVSMSNAGFPGHVFTLLSVTPAPTAGGLANAHCFESITNVPGQPNPYYPGAGTTSASCGSGLSADGNAPSGCSPPTDVQSGKQLGPDCDCNTGSVKAGEPIDIGSGNVSYQTTDYETAGQNKLSFVRYYNSRTSFSGILGTNWSSNFDRYIYLWSSSSVLVQRPNGQSLTFTLSGGTWSPDTDVDYKLVNSGSTWTLTDPDDMVESYTVNTSGGVAVLNTITARNGYTQTLTHTSGGNQVSSVTDSYNRTLTFTVGSNGLLSSLGTPEATTLTYGYNGSSLAAQLATVTYPTSPATSSPWCKSRYVSGEKSAI